LLNNYLVAETVSQSPLITKFHDSMLYLVAASTDCG